MTRRRYLRVILAALLASAFGWDWWDLVRERGIVEGGR